MVSHQEFIATLVSEVDASGIEVTLQTTLEQLDIDSLDAVSLIFALEDKYGVDVNPDDIVSAKTVGELYTVIFSLEK
jgi:acyl carrier protein